MTITVAGITFDHVRYDARGDVLYLNVGEPQPAARGMETPEGHGVHYGEDDEGVGLTLLNVKWTLEREGELVLSMPEASISRALLAPALTGG